jgi:hypothetical protein
MSMRRQDPSGIKLMEFKPRRASKQYGRVKMVFARREGRYGFALWRDVGGMNGAGEFEKWERRDERARFWVVASREERELLVQAAQAL